MSLQIIEKDGHPEWAIIPYDEYQRLLAALEDKADALAIADALGKLSHEDVVPAHVAERLLAENPYRVWREYRGLTQEAVAAAAGVTKAYISMIESGGREPSAKVLAAIAKALRLAPEDLE